MEYYSIPAQKKKDILHPKVATQQSCLPFVPKSIADNTSQSIHDKEEKSLIKCLIHSLQYASFVFFLHQTCNEK